MAGRAPAAAAAPPAGAGPIGAGFPHRPLALAAASPSRAHGLSAADEAAWRRSAVSAVISAALRLRMDHVAAVTALELLHRFYAQRSMVANDRFAVAAGCLFLAGKVADTPKPAAAVAGAMLAAVVDDRAAAAACAGDRAWSAAAREAVYAAERALLQQTGFRFAATSAPEAAVGLLGGGGAAAAAAAAAAAGAGGAPPPTLARAAPALFGGDAAGARRFTRLAYHFANQSTKTPLCLAYPPPAVAAGCAWLALRALCADTAPLRADPSLRAAARGGPWYAAFGLTATDLGVIAEAVLASVAEDADAVRAMGAAAGGAAADGDAAAAGGAAASAGAPAPAAATKRLLESQDEGEAPRADADGGAPAAKRAALGSQADAEFGYAELFD